MKAACLDTRILSQYLNGKDRARESIEALKASGFEVYTTTINITEIFMGIYKVRTMTEKELERLRDFFLSLHPRTVEYDTARLAGQLHATMLKGMAIGWRDTFIAAIALQHGKTIVTSKVSHFTRVPGLDVVDYT